MKNKKNETPQNINSQIRYEIQDAIKYVGINTKTSGGWKDFIKEPVVEDILKRLTNKLEHLKIKVPAGKCPQCHTETVFGRAHFPEADEHYQLVNYGIEKVIEALTYDEK